MSKKLLKDCAYYVTDRISSSNLTSENYIGVDNMLPNKAGVTLSESVPTSGDVTAFNVGDILIGNIRPYFKKIWLANFDGGCSPDVLCIRCNRDVPPEYLYGVLSQDSFFDYDMAGSKGSKMPRGDKNHIMNYPIPILNDMSKIGDFIIDINAKISNNNRINSELESMAKTIYDYWFTQFDFPDENGKPYKSSGGKMVWNEELKREIPEGWGVNNILDVCNIIDCLHSKKPDYYFESESAYLLTLENLTKDGHVDIAKKYYVSISDYYEWTSRIEIQENDFVVTNAGRAGDICKIPSNVKCAIGRNITAIRPININPYFLEMFFKSSLVREQIMGNLDCGSFFMSFNVKSIKKLHILTPPDKIIDDCCKTFQDISKKIETNIIENQQLASLRDWLLPMLMNGQVGFEGE